MKKKFNTTGVCYPALHYMMDNSGKIKKIMAMIERGDYFVMNRPRQYGKTTTLFFLETALNKKEDYLPIRTNFQGVDDELFTSNHLFTQMIAQQITQSLSFQSVGLKSFLEKECKKVHDIGALSNFITNLVHHTNKKLVWMIDEVDASSAYGPFINFLGMLRAKYLDRFAPYHATFYSIILSGVHDIKTLKQKIRKPSDSEMISPWNIVVNFNVRMSFQPEEIVPMLQEYSEVESIQMDIPLMAEKLYYYTAGYPFLVSKLCSLLTEDILPSKVAKQWELEDIERAVQILLKETNINFETLIKNLENNSDLYQLAYRVLIEGERIPFSPYEPVTHLGRLYGIFKLDGHLQIHNRIYEQVLYNYMIAKTLILQPKDENYGSHFLLDNNQLDIKAVLLKFQQMMKEQYSLKKQTFLEEQGRLLFLAYLTPILNGQGYAFKEVQTSMEKRLDIVITYFQHRYIIELKRWYGEKAHEKGLDQLADYLDIHGVKDGYLVIFDKRKERAWNQDTVFHKDKRIFMIWV